MTSQTPALMSRGFYAWSLAGAAAVILGVLAALTLCIEPIAPKRLVACWTDHLHTPLIADNLAAGRDKQSLFAGEYFEVDTASLDCLAKGLSESSTEPKVIYISAYATRGSDGEVLLLSEQFDPLTAQNGVGFESLLKRIDADPAPKLLVLDMTCDNANGLAGLLPCGAGEVVHGRLQKSPPQNCLTIVSCAAGESPARLENVGRTTFGYFFETGLAGAADSYNSSGVTDGRVTATELANYVANRVARWSQQHGAASQNPQFYRSDAADFVLTAARRIDLPSQDAAAIEAYPEWLVEAWKRRDGWKTSGEAFVIPRLVKRYEADLIEAEYRWRWNGPADHYERWETNCRTVLQEIEAAQKRLAAKPVVSLAQLTTPVNQDYVQAWLTWFAAPDIQAGAAVFENAAEGASYEALALSALTAVTESGELLRDGLSIVADKLAERSNSPQFIEVADIRMLAEIAKRRPDAEAATLAEFLRVATLRSQVASDYALPTMLVDELEIANQNRQTALAALAAPGYASLDDARKFNSQAMRDYQAVVSRQKLLHRVHNVVNEALANLPAMTPLLRILSSDRDDWSAAMRDADDLLAMLESKSDQDDDAIDATTGRLEQRLQRLTEIASAESVTLLAEEVRHGDPQRTQLANALLETSLVAAEDRAKLVTALREAAVSLTAPLSAFAYEPRGASGGAALRMAVGESTRTDELAQWETEVAFATLQLASLLSNEMPPASDILQAQTSLRSALADAHSADLCEWSAQKLQRACSVLPPHPFQPLLDKRDQTPTLLSALAQRENWADRYASRVFDAAKDLQAPSPYLDLARRLDPSVTTKAAWLRVGGATDGVAIELANLSLQQPIESLTVQIDHPASETPTIEVLQPADCLLVDREIHPTPSGSEVQLTFTLDKESTLVEQLATHGVLLRVRRGEEVTHRRLATPGVAGVSPIELLVEIAGVRIPWSERIDLPPTVGPTPLRLIAVNHSDRPIALQAEIEAGATLHAEAQIDAGSEALLKLAPATPPIEGAATAEVLSSLAVKLRDGATELMKSTADLGVAEPAAYLRLHDARYVNDGASAPRLRFVVERLEAAPTPVNLLWSVSSEASPDMSVVKAGTLAATLTDASPLATMEAELAVGFGASGRLNAIATINGVSGAIAFVSDDQLGTRSSVLKRSTKPTLQLVAPAMIASGASLAYSIDTQSASMGVTLETTLVPADSEATVSSAALHRYPTPRRHTVLMTAPSKPGDLTVVNTIGAWSGEFDTTGLSGYWKVAAVAIDSDGVVVARTSADVVIDGEAPSRVELSPTSPLVAGKPAAFRIDALDEFSGVESVRVYLGYSEKNAPPADAKPVVAAPLAGQPDAWSATLPMPAASTAVVTVETTDRVGLVRNNTQQLVLIDEAAASLGSVAGTVVEGVMPQPDLTVELRDPQQQPVASSKTDAKGAFHFAGVKPGKYLVWSVKAASQRVDAAAVDVQAGTEAKVDLKLSL
jgi:hypothetical protein